MFFLTLLITQNQLRAYVTQSKTMLPKGKYIGYFFSSEGDVTEMSGHIFLFSYRNFCNIISQIHLSVILWADLTFKKSSSYGILIRFLNLTKLQNFLVKKILRISTKKRFSMHNAFYVYIKMWFAYLTNIDNVP